MTELEVLDDRTALVQIYIKGDSMGDAAQQAVKQLRSDYVPAAFGQTASACWSAVVPPRTSTTSTP